MDEEESPHYRSLPSSHSPRGSRWLATTAQDALSNCYASVTRCRARFKQSVDSFAPPDKPRRCAFCACGALSLLCGLGPLWLLLSHLLRSHGLHLMLANLPAESEGGLATMPNVDLQTMGGYQYASEALADVRTGVHFPSLLLPDNQWSKSRPLMGLGAGVRLKAVGPMQVNIYSACFYADPAGIREHMPRFQGKTTAQLAANSEFYASLRDAPIDRAVLIIIQHHVSREMLVGAFAQQLQPRLEVYAPGDVARLLDLWQGLWPEFELKVGDALLLWNHGDSLHLRLGLNDDTQPRRSVGEPALVRAFFALYTDASTPAPAVRDRLADRFPNAWRRSGEAALTASLTLEVPPANKSALVPGTSVSMPYRLQTELNPSGKRMSLRLAGTCAVGQGLLRSLSWTAQPEYGVGLYFNEEEWARLSRGRSTQDTKERLLPDGDYLTRTLRLEMTRHTDSGAWMTALAKHLTPALTPLVTSPDEVDRALCALRDLHTFDMPAGQVLYLHCAKGVLYAVVNDAPRQAIDTRLGAPLCKALLAIFLAPDGVAGRDGAQSLVSRLDKWPRD